MGLNFIQKELIGLYISGGFRGRVVDHSEAKHVIKILWNILFFGMTNPNKSSKIKTWNLDLYYLISYSLSCRVYTWTHCIILANIISFVYSCINWLFLMRSLIVRDHTVCRCWCWTFLLCFYDVRTARTSQHVCLLEPRWVWISGEAPDATQEPLCCRRCHGDRQRGPAVLKKITFPDPRHWASLLHRV